MKITEGNITFDFCEDDGSIALKYDESKFYVNHFEKIVPGTKAVDIVYIDRLDKKSKTWLIEIKDYRHPDTVKIKPSELCDAIAIKVKDTLAGLVAARINSNDNDDRLFAREALKSSAIRIVLHMEQNNKRIRLIDPADMKLKLKQRLRSVDYHPLVTNAERHKSDGVNWSVT